MAERTALFVALAALLVCACGGDPAPPEPPAESASGAFALPPPRRPGRRFYLVRTTARCEIFMEDGGERTDPFATPCPEFLQVGERIRIAGKTCFLDNKAQPERERPVVCPDPLTHFEKQVRGEVK